MGVTEDLADDLALQVIKYVDASGDEGVVNEIVALLGATSQTAEEAFLTSMRVRRANQKARALLLQKVKAFKARQEAAGTADTSGT
ncbi:hypothetical protein [Roseovarius indicus]|jgi:hypothetical protein|uniref:Uncharacterized protein n=1 Tax=Roseovarius indicus TaxID=540747 RepID=A0A0T5P9K0_9RHOB|nr:hypothetical protein [Roseovarius indicus]KRS17986.1 hypothetical protein XM52_10555 [Roseovarius indicus]OAO02666.1 hypothetical protein A8B76_04810 [Roseovarius indicus]QEW27193.1 hypothetical protein RIdsm_03004 [Roseovarius indicus]SFD52544.1 hypothetical protein SAMN04488031_101341 [Roseovarius indicus]